MTPRRSRLRRWVTPDGTSASSAEADPAGKAEISSCEARAIQVRAGKRGGVPQPRPATARPAAPSRSTSAGPRTATSSASSRGSLCLLPFPDDYYTVADPSTATGRRIDFHRPAMPANAASVAHRPGPYNRATTASAPGRRSSSGSRGWTHPAALQQTERGADQPPRPLLRARRARRRDRRDDRQALADLGRDRLQRRHPGEHRAGDPPGGELRLRATATSSPCAT